MVTIPGYASYDLDKVVARRTVEEAVERASLALAIGRKLEAQHDLSESLLLASARVGGTIESASLAQAASLACVSIESGLRAAVAVYA